MNYEIGEVGLSVGTPGISLLIEWHVWMWTRPDTPLFDALCFFILWQGLDHLLFVSRTSDCIRCLFMITCHNSHSRSTVTTNSCATPRILSHLHLITRYSPHSLRQSPLQNISESSQYRAIVAVFSSYLALLLLRPRSQHTPHCTLTLFLFYLLSINLYLYPSTPVGLYLHFHTTHFFFLFHPFNFDSILKKRIVRRP